MKTRTKLWMTVVAIGFLSILLIAIDLYHTCMSARRIAAQEAARFTDCTYGGTRLSYSQIYTPPRVLRLPHWEVTYNSPNPSHQFTRIVTLSEARAEVLKATASFPHNTR
jgi:hypothetical protein